MRYGKSEAVYQRAECRLWPAFSHPTETQHLAFRWFSEILKLRNSDDQVARIAGSIKEFGWTNTILVDGENGIIAGHGRLAAARKLGMSEVPVIELDGLSDVQKRAYIIADNKMALDAGWDDELLKIEFEDLKIEGYDLDHTGFSEVEIGNVLNGWDSDIPELDEDGEPDIGSRIVLKIAAEDEAQAKEVITNALDAAGIGYKYS